ncbi:S8 family serine peptidase [Candidatus Bathyarchaeota archaeon]|nr:S8 family serine peptidase [Candidatus Bathyarchaeota archaeon]
MRKKFKRAFCSFVVVFLMLAVCSQVLLGLKNIPNVSKLVSDAEDLSHSGAVLLLDANGNKIVDSLEREIQEKPSQIIRVLIQYRKEGGFSNFISELNSLFPTVNVKYRYTLVSAIVVDVPAEAVSQIAKLSSVLRIEPDTQVQITLDTAVPVINADRVWTDYGFHGESQTIAILDTGIWPEHPDFQGKIVGWVDFINSNPTPYDDNGHGTMVASIAAGAGAGSNGTYKGVAYMANIVAVKVLDAKGRGYTSTIIMGLEWVAAKRNTYNITVTNLSLGSIGPSDGKDALSLACNYLVDEGIVVVVAAGNFGPRPYTVGSPAAAEKVIAVGAVDRSSDIASFSSRGPTLDDRFKPDICAVGVAVTAGSLPYLKYPEMQWQIYRSVSGTSAAAPMIAGAAALLRQAHPDWPPEKVKAALLTRTVQKGGGINNDYGYGIANVFEALQGPKPTLTINTWKFINGVPTFAEARAYGQRSPEPYVLVRGTWFTPNSLLTLKWDNTTILAENVQVDENRVFAVNVTIPRSTWGIHYVSVWRSENFITQHVYEILRPTLAFSASELFQTTIDFGRPGVTIWARGEYYDPNGSVTVKWDNTTILAADVSTDSSGIFKTSITIPLDASAGIHYISIWNETEFATQKLIHILKVTPVSGVISENTTWTKYGSPYNLTGHLIIDEFASLTIEPGVEIKANGYRIWVNSNAKLNATGTPSEPIIFNGTGIQLRDVAENASITIKNCIITKAQYGFYAPSTPCRLVNVNISIENSVFTKNGKAISMEVINIPVATVSFYIVNNKIVENYGDAIKIGSGGGLSFNEIRIVNNTIVSNDGNGIVFWVYGISGVLEIAGNTIRSNGGDGLRICWYNFPPMPITRNHIAYNSGAGIFMSIPGTTFGGDTTPLITQNYITRNAYGIVVYRGAASDVPEHIPTIFFNDIHSNAYYDLEILNTGDRKYNATYNYWGTLSANEISQKIWDFYDDFSLERVVYMPFLNMSTRASVFGYLTDFATGFSIANATIEAEGPIYVYSYSNGTGYFMIDGLLPGEYVIKISKEGYETVTWFESVGAAQAFESSISMRRLEGYGEATVVFDVIVDGETYPVAVTTNSTVSDFNFSLEHMQISFKVAGIDGTTGFCNVSIPNRLLGGPYTVFVNDTPITPTITSNSTHTFIKFTYNHSEKTIKIVGTSVIPEFPMALYLPIFIALSFIAITFSKNRK